MSENLTQEQRENIDKILAENSGKPIGNVCGIKYNSDGSIHEHNHENHNKNHCDETLINQSGNTTNKHNKTGDSEPLIDGVSEFGFDVSETSKLFAIQEDVALATNFIIFLRDNNLLDESILKDWDLKSRKTVFDFFGLNFYQLELEHHKLMEFIRQNAENQAEE